MTTAPNHRLKRSVRLLTGAGMLALVALGGSCGSRARAQSVELPEKESTLQEVTERLQRQTGYEFHLALSKELEEVRHPVPSRRASLSATLADLASLFHCDFFSLDAGGFYVVATPKQEEVETTAGPYHLRVGRVTETDQAGVLQLTLEFAGQDEAATEAIAGLDDVQIQDNFGRALLPPAKTLRTTTGTRVRLTEYWQRLPLYLKDDRAVRLRLLRGNLVLYRKVAPLRMEFPLEGVTAPVTRDQAGVECRLERVVAGDGRWTVDTRLQWKAAQAVLGQGLSRTPQPYLVDAGGRVYRDVAPRLARFRTPQGDPVLEQHLRYEGLDAKPARLVYDLYEKEDPAVTVPFRIGGLPLPGTPNSGARPEQRPFFDAENGGTAVLSVVDRDGKPAEGEFSLGLSRSEGGVWSGIRWLDEVTDAEGRVRVEHLKAGTYRIIRVFRQDPSLPPVSVGRTSVEVTVPARGEVTAPALRLPVRAM